MPVRTVLDTLGNIFTQLGVDPAIASITLAFAVALYPPLKRGVLDDRIEELSESIDTSLLVLSIGFLLAFYFQFGLMGLQDELLGITGGFVVGTFVVRLVTRLTGIE